MGPKRITGFWFWNFLKFLISISLDDQGHSAQYFMSEIPKNNKNVIFFFYYTF